MLNIFVWPVTGLWMVVSFLTGISLTINLFRAKTALVSQFSCPSQLVMFSLFVILSSVFSLLHSASLCYPDETIETCRTRLEGSSGKIHEELQGNREKFP